MKLPSASLDPTAPVPMRTDVILLDIIAYTLLPNDKQYAALYYLNRIIGTVTSLLDMRSVLQGERVIDGAIPNGDGCFFILNPRIAGYGPLLALFLRNFLLFNNRFLDHLFNGVRCSVHHGELMPIEFLGTKNYVGDGINVCARLQGKDVEREAGRHLDGDSNFVSVSAQAYQAFQELFPPDKPEVQHYLSKINFRHSPVFTIRDKHKHLPDHRACFIDCAKVIGSAPPRPKELLAS